MKIIPTPRIAETREGLFDLGQITHITVSLGSDGRKHLCEFENHKPERST